MYTKNKSNLMLVVLQFNKEEAEILWDLCERWNDPHAELRKGKKTDAQWASVSKLEREGFIVVNSNPETEEYTCFLSASGKHIMRCVSQTEKE